MNKSLVLGLTGPTGSGKSTAAAAMRACGCRVIDADQVARQAVAPGSSCLKQLQRFFGEDIVGADGQLIRSLLAQRAFASRENTDQLNAITHPWITEKVREMIGTYRTEGAGWIVLDAPLLFESGEDQLCDAVIVVTAPQDLRLTRIMARDHITWEQAKARMSAQPDEGFYTRRADYVLHGDGEPQHLQKATKRLIATLQEE